MIRVEGLTRSYGSTVAIRDLAFTVGKGELVGFLGPNGAGKSTTMRILAGALGATAGRALVGGIDVLEDPHGVKAILGYLPEVPPLYPEMSVGDFLLFCARVKGAKDPKAAVARDLARTRLDDVAHRLVGNLSKGYRQRVGLAQALVHDPAVLVLDEPTSGLDPAQRVEMRTLIRGLADGGATVLLSTHVLAEVEAICDRAIVVSRGRIVASDTLERLTRGTSRLAIRVASPDERLAGELAALPGVSAVEPRGAGRFLVTADEAAWPALAAAAVRCGLLEQVPQRGLEDRYLRLTLGEDGHAEPHGEPQ